MREAHGFEKSCEVAGVAHQTFHLDFFAQVESIVGLEYLLGICRGPDDGQQAMRERLLQVEFVAELASHIRMQVLLCGAAAQ